MRSKQTSGQFRDVVYSLGHRPLIRYVKLRMRRECWERPPPPPPPPTSLVSDPGMHHGTCVTHVLWCNLTYMTRRPWWGINKSVNWALIYPDSRTLLSYVHRENTLFTWTSFRFDLFTHLAIENIISIFCQQAFRCKALSGQQHSCPKQGPLLTLIITAVINYGSSKKDKHEMFFASRDLCY